MSDLTTAEIWLRGLEITYQMAEAKLQAADDDDMNAGYSTVELAEGADMFLGAFCLRWEPSMDGWTRKA